MRKSGQYSACPSAASQALCKMLAGQYGAISGRRHEFQLPVGKKLVKIGTSERGSDLGEHALTHDERSLRASLAQASSEASAYSEELVMTSRRTELSSEVITRESSSSRRQRPFRQAVSPAPATSE
jgi:hypothetical protein